MGIGWQYRRRERLDGLADLLMFARGARVLDLGCNRGLVGYEFAKRGATLVHGCDITPAAIATATHLFSDWTGGNSRHAVIDLAGGPAALEGFALPDYSIVVMLGVYHKLRRVMPAERLSALMRCIADMTSGHFAWNGFPDEFDAINNDMKASGLHCVHRSTISGQPTAAWLR